VLDRLTPSYLLRSLLALGAVVIVLVGATPMAVAATNPDADPIVAQATDGAPQLVNLPAPAFTLTDQYGHRVTLASLRGRTVVLTFLDPVCTSDCPLIAQELRLTDQMLGQQAGSVDLVAVVTNSVYDTTEDTKAFDNQEDLEHLPNWIYLTGPASQLERVWNDYGVEALLSPAGAMVDHSDIVYIIDKTGRDREIIDSDPGGGTGSDLSSFSTMLSQQLQQYLHP
jgi:cytochrome oxidase Cu insertion factor (SCO1/SenC/PrrC family)